MNKRKDDISPFDEEHILRSWNMNAPEWVKAVREGQIASRRQVTDAAIIEAVLSRSPQTVLDVGCGEGWLARELTVRGIHVTGIDAVAELVEDARAAGGGDFHVLTYDELSAGKLSATVDVVACNFSLLGRESSEGMIRAAASLLNSTGSLIVQTLHPVVACGDLPYRDSWREGSWAGFSSGFTDPAPWYFRTLESWIALFSDCGFQLHEMREPLLPSTQKPASVIFIAEPIQ